MAGEQELVRSLKQANNSYKLASALEKASMEHEVASQRSRATVAMGARRPGYIARTVSSLQAASVKQGAERQVPKQPSRLAPISSKAVSPVPPGDGSVSSDPISGSEYSGSDREESGTPEELPSRPRSPSGAGAIHWQGPPSKRYLQLEHTGVVKLEELQMLHRMYKEVESMSGGGPVTIPKFKAYCTWIGQDVSATRELTLLMGGLLISIERRLKEVVTFRDMTRIMYPLACDDEIDFLLASVERPREDEVLDDGASVAGSILEPPAGLRDRIDPQTWRAIRDVFNLIDKRHKGTIPFDTMANILAPFLPGTSQEQLMKHMKKVAGPRKALMSVDDLMEWYAQCKAKSMPLVPLEKLKLSLMGPDFVLASYIHEDEDEEEYKRNVEKLRVARPEGGTVRSCCCCPAGKEAWG